MKVQIEESFPRGGSKPTTKNVDKPIQQNLFGLSNVKSKAKHKRDTKKEKEKRKQAAELVDEELVKEVKVSKPVTEDLRMNKIQEGMVILSCIHTIKALSLTVELPGSNHGIVLIKFISTQFSDELNRRLEEENAKGFTQLSSIFSFGQFIPAKVLNVKPQLLLSVSPHDINSNLRHKQLKKGMLVWGAIAEKADHAYIVSLGVNKCRAVLPFDNVEEGRTYKIGQPFYSIIIKCETLEASTLTLSTLKTHFEGNIIRSDTSLDNILPGTQVKFTIDTITKEGLDGKFANQFRGYVNNVYLTDNDDKLENYEKDAIVKASVMYLEPVTKTAYLTLRNLNTIEKPELRFLDTARAQIVAKTFRGFVLKINDKFVGCISSKRILETINAKKNINEIIATKYAMGTEHQCKILTYNHFNRMYICTFNMNHTKSTKIGLKCGEIVNGLIAEVQDQGLLVTIKNIQGYINNNHLSNALYSENIKKKFKVGQKINAKVWRLQNNRVRLTIKPELMSTDLHLSNIDEAIINKAYVGIVVKSTLKGVLVVFYGNLKGWLPKKNIPQCLTEDGKVDNKIDVTQIFYIGQIIKCFVVSKSERKLSLSLENKSSKTIILRPGELYKKAKIVEISDSGLLVKISDRDAKAFLPIEHLAPGEFGRALFKTYKVGDSITDLLCISIENPPIVSIKEYREHGKKIPIFKFLDYNSLIRCSFVGEDNIMFKMSAPIKNYIKKLSIPKNLLPDDFKFPPYAPIIAKITDINHDSNKLKIETDLACVFNFDYNYSMKMLNNYLGYIDIVQNRLLEINDDIVKLRIGERVKCVVDEFVDGKNCSVTILPYNIKGVVNIKHHCNKGSKKSLKGKEVEGVIFWINYEERQAQVVLKTELMNKINKIQDGKLDDGVLKSNCFGHLLMVNSEFAMAVLNNKGNQQFIYLPVRIHENDFFPDSSHYENLIGTKIKIIPYLTSCGRIIGMDKKTIKSLNASKKNNKIPEAPKINENNPNKRKQNVKNSGNPKKAKKQSEPESDEGIASGNEGPTSSVADNLDNANDSDSDVTMEESDINQMILDSSDESDDDIELDPVLPGVQSFFKSNTVEETTENQESSSDDEDKEETSTKKKRKLKASERAELAKEEEARLRKIENELADSNALPQSADQFDRILMGNPDNSEMWTRYIAFHAQATEFEKARSIAKRALDKISYTATQDRLNVWLAYLNLENMYGTKESFDKIFEEAARCNDSLTVYLESIKMLAEMHKLNEMEEKIKKVRAKYKQDLKMWLDVGKVYYECKRFVDARKLKDNALVTLTDKKTHVHLIVQFAILEFIHGEQNQGEALFETILQADPKRVDVWCTYVDQLIKKESIDIARNVLNRAVGQKLPYKKMRTLFKKFHNFETTYGDEESLGRIKTLLEEYADNK